jgi:hypothetical protein
MENSYSAEERDGSLDLWGHQSEVISYLTSPSILFIHYSPRDFNSFFFCTYFYLFLFGWVVVTCTWWETLVPFFFYFLNSDWQLYFNGSFYRLFNYFDYQIVSNLCKTLLSDPPNSIKLLWICSLKCHHQHPSQLSNISRSTRSMSRRMCYPLFTHFSFEKKSRIH